MRYFFASYTCGQDNSGRGAVTLSRDAFPSMKLLVDQAVKTTSAPAHTVIITSLFEFKCAEDFNSFLSKDYDKVDK